ncbi:chemotaxis protein CheD [Vagococcus sp. BWB3-3]|uniref:Probable chemoreceptor glutamine deamidase CheD n=1 Tax=Vagococcus allomyrinae TaxID=2794353 RepID=A0A940SWE5_9ENTE|nr:chemotaxis protein CheD [Vagococcus allomyrinae]MBP1042026.1 chemotaxis protein CheD [Vagococcus allomyrinae]
MQEIKVGISDYKISEAPNKLMTLGLGSCIAIAVYDERQQIGGLSHIMLPDSQLFIGRPEIKKEKFADLALPLMVSELKAKCPRARLVAKIAGGASMFNFTDTKNRHIGERNVEAVEAILSELKIPILASHTGGNMGRSFFMDLTSLAVTVKMVNREMIDL